MDVRVDISHGPLAPPGEADRPAQAGAVLVFEGIVRPTEDGQPIDGLEYETYEPMAQHILMGIATDIAKTHGLSLLTIEHSRGFVPAQSVSLRVRAASPHRAQAIDAVSEVIDRLKVDVPIWKHVVVRAGVDTPR